VIKEEEIDKKGSFLKSISNDQQSKIKEKVEEDKFSNEILDIKVEPQLAVFEDERLNLQDKTRSKNLQP